MRRNSCLLTEWAQQDSDRINFTKSPHPDIIRETSDLRRQRENSFFCREQKIVFLQKKDYLTTPLKEKADDQEALRRLMWLSDVKADAQRFSTSKGSGLCHPRPDTLSAENTPRGAPSLITFQSGANPFFPKGGRKITEYSKQS